MRRLLLLLVVLGLVVSVGACGSAARTRTVALATLNESGVTGTVVLTESGDTRTRVEIQVSDGGNLDMPAHIHPGTCTALVPQPKYPLENVRNGDSVTIVPATFDELGTGQLAVNIHRSVDDLKTYTACADLGGDLTVVPPASVVSSNAASASGADLVVATAAGSELKFVPDVPVAAQAPRLTLLFQNESTVAHNLTFSGLPARSSTIVEPGASELIVVDVPAPGAYAFVCTIHPGMQGTLTVH